MHPLFVRMIVPVAAAIFAAGCSSAQEASRGLVVSEATMHVGEHSTLREVKFNGDVIGVSVQQYAFNSDHRHIIWSSGCPDPVKPNTKTACGVFWFDSTRGTSVVVEPAPKMTPYLVNVPLGGEVGFAADVWSPDGKYAAVQTTAALHILELETGRFVECPGSRGSESAPYMPTATTKGVIWGNGTITTVPKGNDEPREFQLASLF